MGHIIKPEWKNPTRGVQTKDVIKNYFAQLTKSQIADLYEMFRFVRSLHISSLIILTIIKHNASIYFRRYDFVLFGYSPDDYLAIGSDDLTPLVCRK